MNPPISGIHHITAIASNPQANLDFYHGILGQRLIKTTVNFDDPGTYHFYFGDYTGTPGTIMTFFPWPNARRGVIGNGQIGASAYTIRPESVGYWLDRFKKFNVPTGAIQQRFNQQVLSFQDRDGLPLELIVEDTQPKVEPWESSIPAEHALRGFHGVTLWVSDAAKTAALLSDTMGYRQTGEQGRRLRFQGQPGSLGSFVDLLERKGGTAGQGGAGTIHHVAFRNQNDTEQLAYRQQVMQAGYDVTPVRDRQYFHSIYFREPNGVLFEYATNPPGFTLDEDIAHLGESLRLPPWLEPQRSGIEAAVLPITRRLPPEPTPGVTHE